MHINRNKLLNALEDLLMYFMYVIIPDRYIIPIKHTPAVYYKMYCIPICCLYIDTVYIYALTSSRTSTHFSCPAKKYTLVTKLC